MLCDKSLQKLPPNGREEDPLIQNILLNWARSFRQSDHDSLPQKASWLIKRRLSLFHTTSGNRDVSSKSIKIAPKAEGRIVCLGEKLSHSD